LKRTLLIVDDDADCRQAVHELLVQAGYHVLTASNGQEALRLLSRGIAVDLIVLDLMMPVMNGWEFLDALGDSEVPVIVLSSLAKDTKTVSAVALRHARSGVMRKPADPEKLLEAVREHCGIAALE